MESKLVLLQAKQTDLQAQETELLRQAATIRASYHTIALQCHSIGKELCEARSYLHTIDQSEPETDPQVRAAQSRLALAYCTRADLGADAALSADIAGQVAHYIVDSAIVEGQKLLKFGQEAANARRQLRFGIRLEGFPESVSTVDGSAPMGVEFNGLYKLVDEIGGFPVLMHQSGKHLACCRFRGEIWTVWALLTRAPTEDILNITDPCQLEQMLLVVESDDSRSQDCGFLPIGKVPWMTPDGSKQTLLTTSLVKSAGEIADIQEIEEELCRQKRATATSQLAGVSQLVISGVPWCMGETSHHANGLYERFDFECGGFPIFRSQFLHEDQSGGERGYILTYSRISQVWGIQDVSVEPGGRPDVLVCFVHTKDGKLPVGAGGPWQHSGVSPGQTGTARSYSTIDVSVLVRS